MRRFALALTATCLAALALAAAPAQGAFGLHSFDVTFTNQDGTPAPAGSHPFAMTTAFGTNLDGEPTPHPEGWIRDAVFEQIPGLVGDTTAYPRCTTADFLVVPPNSEEPACPRETQVGIIAVSVSAPGLWNTFPVFNITPPPGTLLRLGFRVQTNNIVVDAGLSPDPPYNAFAASRNTIQALEGLYGSVIQLWGDPSDPDHDELRGPCGSQSALLAPGDIGFEFESTGKSCPVAPRPKAFLTLPTNCSGPLATSYEALSWNDLDEDGAPDSDAGFALTHDPLGNPAPLRECGKLGFHPSISARPTSRAAQSPTGLDFSLDVEDEGLTSVTGRRQSDIRKAIVTLPEGMTANPSVAEGLEVCSEDNLDDEALSSAPGEGCPQASKIGTLEVESPLVEEPIDGALYQATPHANLAEDSLLAFYMVFKNPQLGIIVKLPVKVLPDPETGQLMAISDDLPQVPFSHFRLHFREGGRSPLVSPPLCGTYEVSAELTPWSDATPYTATSAFQIISGPNEGPCSQGGTPPFEPGFAAGSQSNAAGAYSPFSMRLTRRDGDQDLTRFDATLPPGVVAKLAGVSRCFDAQIARARTKTGIGELQSPSCPANSRIGSVIGGAGVGPQLTYVRGTIYMAGPFGGAPLSAVAVVPAVAGPFDVGTVVYRQALRVNPRTGEVTADGAGSDPLPHILAGIPLVVRDVQVHVDRSQFTINPTSCDPFATEAAIWGGGINAFSVADDSPVQRQARYQAASCASLGFKPRLSLKLKGGTKRGAHPRLRAVLRPRSGDANISGTVVRLPRSAFLDQGHIRTICTRVQYAAKACPEGAVYGHVRAFTPLLSEPLEGPAYLRSSNHNLPDLVYSLRGLVDFEAVARIDSKKGGIRATFTGVPDAPISKVIVNMEGGSKGLIVNSTDLCAEKHRANVRFDAHNGKRHTVKPLMQASCGKSKQRRSAHR
jgi:hypothetical protein